MVRIELTEDQTDYLLELLENLQDDGPGNSGWKSQKLLKIISIIDTATDMTFDVDPDLYDYINTDLLKIDKCPECKAEMMSGPNGSSVCSKCPYWRL